LPKVKIAALVGLQHVVLLQAGKAARGGTFQAARRRTSPLSSTRRRKRW